MTDEQVKIEPLSVTQERALRYIAGAVANGNQFYITRTVNKRTLAALIERGLIATTPSKGLPIYSVTDAGQAMVAAGGPLT